MASTVYFARLKAGSADESAVTRVRTLFDEAQFGTLIEADALTAISFTSANAATIHTFAQSSSGKSSSG